MKDNVSIKCIENKIKRGNTFFPLLILIGLMLSLTACFGPKKVSTALVSQKEMPLTYVADANVTALYKETILPTVSGTVAEFKVKVNDEVKKGQVLAVLDKASLEAQLAMLEQKRMTASAAPLAPVPSGALGEAKKLLEVGIITQKEYAALVARGGAGSSSYRGSNTEGLDALIAQVKASLAQAEIKATIDGKVTAIYNEDRKIAIADRPFMLIQQSTPVVATFNLPANGALYFPQKLWSSSPVYLRLKDKEVKGELTFIDLGKAEGATPVLAKATFSNDGNIVPGEFYPILVESQSKGPALVVPTKAVRKQQEGHFVYVVTADHTVDIRHVTIGTALEGYTVIVDGVQAEEEVILTEGTFEWGEKITK